MFSDDLPWNWRKRKRNGVVFGRVHRNRSPFFLSCSKIIRSSHFQEHVGFLSYNIKISLVWSVACYAWSAKYHLFYGQVASIMLSSVQLPLSVLTTYNLKLNTQFYWIWVIYSNSLRKNSHCVVCFYCCSCSSGTVEEDAIVKILKRDDRWTEGRTDRRRTIGD